MFVQSWYSESIAEQLLFCFIVLLKWVVCSAPHALSTGGLSPDTLSPHALSPCDGLSENRL